MSQGLKPGFEAGHCAGAEAPAYLRSECKGEQFSERV